MVRTYKSMKVEWEEDPHLMDAYPVKIEKVRFCSGAFDCGKTDGLFLQLRLFPEDKLHYFGLVGKEIHDMFKDEARVEDFSYLQGRYILGNFNEDKSKLESLMFLK